MLCNGGTLDGQRILGRKTVELMTANHMVTLPKNQAAARQKGFGFGVEVTTDLGQLSVPSSVGQFGWYGAATTYGGAGGLDGCLKAVPGLERVAAAFWFAGPFCVNDNPGSGS